MKIILRTSSFLTIILLLWACDKEDDKGVSSNKLSGTWSLTYFILANCDDGEENIEYEVTCTSQNCSKIILSKNGTFKTELTISGHTDIDQGTYTISDNTLRICDATGSDCSPAIFEVTDDGKTLTIADLNEESDCNSFAVYKRI